MFDVPPEEGLHGIQAYRASWPPFFKWQAAAPDLGTEKASRPLGRRARAPLVHARRMKASRRFPRAGGPARDRRLEGGRRNASAFARYMGR